MGEIKAEDTGHVSLIIQFQYKLHTILAATRKQILLATPTLLSHLNSVPSTYHFSESKSVGEVEMVPNVCIFSKRPGFPGLSGLIIFFLIDMAKKKSAERFLES